jgi:hypothetical protein
MRKALAQSRRDALVETMESLEHAFWTSRFNLHAGALTKPQALLGAERIRDIVINVYHPLSIERNDGAWEAFLREKGPAPAAIMRNAARRFFGGIPTASLSLAVTQQGLLQIEHDCHSASEPAEFLSALRQLA